MIIKDKKSLDVVKDLIKRNALIIDARRGGLILGSSHDEGGIIMLSIISVNGVELLCPMGEMEGGEYLINSKATEKYIDTLKEINSFNERFDTKNINIQLNHAYSVYQIEKGGAILADYPQMVVNKNAALRYLHQLSVLNNHLLHKIEAVPPFRYGDFSRKYYGDSIDKIFG